MIIENLFHIQQKQIYPILVYSTSFFTAFDFLLIIDIIISAYVCKETHNAEKKAYLYFYIIDHGISLDAISICLRQGLRAR